MEIMPLQTNAAGEIYKIIKDYDVCLIIAYYFISLRRKESFHHAMLYNLERLITLSTTNNNNRYVRSSDIMKNKLTRASRARQFYDYPYVASNFPHVLQNSHNEALDKARWQTAVKEAQNRGLDLSEQKQTVRVLRQHKIRKIFQAQDMIMELNTPCSSSIHRD